MLVERGGLVDVLIDAASSPSDDRHWAITVHDDIAPSPGAAVTHPRRY
jgi:hypothetical protein